MKDKLYGYADVGRMGLGHGLLAWGRCVAWAHRAGVPVIAPQWLRLRIGPYVRRERDKRSYYRLFQTGGQIGGLQRLRLLASADRLAAVEDLPGPGYLPEKNTVVVFSNLVTGNEKAYFPQILGANEVIRDALTDMTRPKFRPLSGGQPHIAIHIRGGDFSVPEDLSVLRGGLTNARLPIEWYVTILNGLRESLAGDSQAIVYSDCSDEDLAPVLSLASVKRSPNVEAVTDMLSIAQAAALISSGSAFSRWSSFLGGVPRLCFPGQRLIRTLGPVEGRLDLEPQCETKEEIPEDFVVYVQRRLDSARGGVDTC